MPDPKAFLAQMAEVERISERATRAELEPSGGSARCLAEGAPPVPGWVSGPWARGAGLGFGPAAIGLPAIAMPG
jgi:hypothetical protein